MGLRAASPAHGRMRVLRGLVLASASLLIPAAAHVAAGGAVPVDIGFILAAAGLAGACVALADRRRGVVEIGAVVLLAQPVMHAVLSWGGHHDVTADGLTMVVAHVLAGVLVSLLLAGAEAVLWAWWSLWTTILWTASMWRRVRRALAATVPGAPRPAGRRLVAPEALSSASVVLAVAPRRGPPSARMA